MISHRHATATINPAYWERREGCCQLQGRMGEVCSCRKCKKKERVERRWREQKKQIGIEETDEERVQMETGGRGGGGGGEGVEIQIRKGCTAGL